MNNKDAFTSISLDNLEHVTGGAGKAGGWGSQAWSWIKDTASSLFSGEGTGTNINAQIGNNQRSAQGNTGPVSLGDNSPVTVNGQQ
ncbi:MAG TPA: hypothetical protein VMZ53_16660 [Kofleriaceae bacterium]|nr:hypothetical protein [Kofleriaceae bacterium]